jgi:hypothetical protein
LGENDRIVKMGDMKTFWRGGVNFTIYGKASFPGGWPFEKL